MKPETFVVPVEYREDNGGPRIVATLIQEGRAATGGRAELFTPGSVVWPDTGVGIQTVHKGAVEVRAVPTRGADGSITFSARATPAIVDAVNAGRRGMSVSFVALKEQRTAGGVREIERAYVDEAALTDKPEYEQGRAELREKRPRKVTVWL